jgi:prepilin-type N-terminal cleavage/methylation domain-containing protein
MKNKSCVITGRAGFTLIELMVTIGVLAIMASIAIPVFSRWLPGYHLKTAARDVFSNMQLAKLEAVKRNTDCIVTIDTDQNTYDIGLVNKDVSLSEYGSGIVFEGPSTAYATDAGVTFTSQGFASQHIFAYLTNSEKTAYFQIEVMPIGTISLKKYNGSTWE